MYRNQFINFIDYIINTDKVLLPKLDNIKKKIAHKLIEKGFIIINNDYLLLVDTLMSYHYKIKQDSKKGLDLFLKSSFTDIRNITKTRKGGEIQKNIISQSFDTISQLLKKDYNTEYNKFKVLVKDYNSTISNVNINFDNIIKLFRLFLIK